MKAMLSTAQGGPETLELTVLPDPEPKKGEAVARVHAVGVNFSDTLMIRDLYQMKPPRPFAPGGEIAGQVVATGEGVSNVAVGDQVLALTGHGGFATHLSLKAANLVPILDAMPYEDAACFIFTLWDLASCVEGSGKDPAGRVALYSWRCGRRGYRSD